MSDCYEDVNEAEVCDGCDQTYPECGGNPIECMVVRSNEERESAWEAQE